MATPETSLRAPARPGSLPAFLAAGLTPYTLSFVLLLFATFVVFRNFQAVGVAFKPDAIANVGNVLAPLVLIAAFIERAVEVLLTPVRGDHADRLRSRIEKQQEAGGVANRLSSARKPSSAASNPSATAMKNAMRRLVSL